MLALALASAASQPLWRWTDPELAVAVAFTDGLRDPWGNPFLVDAVANPADPAEFVSYSFGPNGHDDTSTAPGGLTPVAGDDVAVDLDVLDGLEADAYRWVWVPPLALSGFMLLALAWLHARAPRGPPVTEAVRVLLVAVPPWVAAQALLDTLERAGLFHPSSWEPFLLAPPHEAIKGSMLALCLCLAAGWRLRPSHVARHEPSDEGGV
jgi:hypothetical protein